MKRLSLILLTLIIAFGAKAQRYWQQEVNYKIRVKLNDENHTLTAFEEIEYINNSPYTLEFIYMHLWPNAYKNNNTAFARQKVRDGSNEFYFADKEDRGWIDGLDFEVDGESVAWLPDENQIDIAKIILNKPLKKGESIIIKTPFKVKLPKTFSRLGHMNQSYQITQWYPKPAVFDKSGWHPMPYLDQGEFYSEFGSFEVDITVPDNYVVAATGVLQNEGEKDWLDERSKLNVPENKLIESSSTSKTLTYKQDKIHDFAWFADKNYNIAKGEVILPQSGRKVDTWYMYTSRYEKTRAKGLKDLHDATYYYSKFVGDYPYSSVTAVTGALGAGGGMEYPMITVTGPSAIVHEVGHNWFYGILGSNERDNGWLDEGLNSFFEEKTYKFQRKSDSINSTENKKGSIESTFSNMQKVTSEAVETRNLNQPVHCTSNAYHSTNYFIQLYQKPVILMSYLEDYLGEELFLKCFHTYYDRWSFKHPHLEDIQKVFEEVSGKDLNWFFRTMIKNNVSPKVRIARMKKNRRGFDATFISDDNVPIKVKLLDDNKDEIKSQWVDFKHGKTSIYFNTDAKKLAIDDENIVFRSNSDKFIRKNGPLKRLRLPQLNLGFPREKVNRSGAGLVPAFGANVSDGGLVGIGLYNTGVRSKKFNYTLVPMFGIKSEEFKGLGTLNYYYYPKRDFYVIEAGLVGQSFSNYNKVAINLAHWSKVELFDISWNQKFKFQSTNINTSDIINDSITINNSYNTFGISYELYHKDAVREFRLKPSISNVGALRSAIEISSSFNFTRNDAVHLRLFGGVMSSSSYQFGLSNGMDYTKDYYSYERNNTNAFQTNGEEGGFRSNDTLNGYRVMSANLTIDIPRLPFSVFYDHGWSDYKFRWGTGLTMNIYKNLIEFYFPLAGTSFKNNVVQDGKDFTNNIRVMLKLPLKSSNEVVWDKI